MLDFAVTAADFRAHHFERAPYLFKSAMAGATWTLEAIDRLLELVEPDGRTLQLFNRGLVAPHTYVTEAVELGQTRRRLDKRAFYSQLRGGATLVMNRIEAHSIECSELCGEISRYVELQTTSNAYLSFGGPGTFGKHWDTHDVFAIQLLGRKRWQIFAPTLPLPLSHQTSESFPQHDIGAPRLDVMLQTGDVLYVPRGWWHEASPLAEPSLHLSVGAYAATMYDYLMWFSGRFLAQHVAARGAIAADAHEDLSSVLAKLSAAALDPQALRQFQYEIDRRGRHAGSFDLASHVIGAPDLRRDALVRLIARCPRGSSREVLANGRVHSLDELSARVISVLRNRAPLTVDALFERIADVAPDTVVACLLALAECDVISMQSGGGEGRRSV